MGHGSPSSLPVRHGMTSSRRLRRPADASGGVASYSAPGPAWSDPGIRGSTAWGETMGKNNGKNQRQMRHFLVKKNMKHGGNN